MTKYVRRRLSVKIFLLTCVMLVAVSGVTYGFIAAVTPQSYLNEIERGTDEAARSLIGHFDDLELDACKDMLSVFAREHDVLVQIYDGRGQAVEGDSESQFMISSDSGEAAPYRTHEVMSYFFRPRGGEMDYRVAVLADGQRVNLFAKTLEQIFPCLLGFVLAVSVLVSWLYSRHLSRPILELSEASRELAGLNFHVRFRSGREDEIGVLWESLGELSENLSEALAELQEANASLKREVEREKEMEQRQLSFFSAVSHELKTPITVLKGQLQGMIYKVGGYRDRDKYLRRSFEVVENMETLVLEILSAARLGTAGFSLCRKEVELEKLLQALLADYEEIALQKEMALVCRLEPVQSVLADEGLMKKAVSNILSNGFRYSPPGSEVRILLNQGQCGVCLAVENTGAAVPDQEIPELFRPFTRGEESRSRETGGSGLGLYLVKMILELHQCRFCMTNIEDGVRFEIYFPG